MYKIIILLLVPFFAACSFKDPAMPDSASSEGNMIELILDSAWVTEYDLLTDSSTRAFYSEINYQAVWFENDTFKPAADSLFRIIHYAAYRGLNPEDYHFNTIKSILEKPYSRISASTVDILFTDAFFTMYFHLQHGRLDKNSLKRITSIAVDSVAFLLLPNGVQDNSIATLLSSQEPRHEEYKFLKSLLAVRLNVLKAKDENYVFVSDHSQKLIREIETISLNMERWRWESYPLPDRFVQVNIPQFEMHVLDCDSVILSSKVVVGAPETPTPVLECMIECFTIYPYWRVPRKISVNELLPIIQRDTSYLRRNNFDVLDRKGIIVDPKTIKWKNLNADFFPYVLRQREGEENSLGIIKFRFENPYAVYLHDTNAKKHFNSNDRALSHGCVRVEKALELAQYLVKGDTNCTTEDLNNYFALRQRKDIDLLFPIPVRIKYLTYKRDRDRIQFLDDVYKIDSLMSEELYESDENCTLRTYTFQLGKTSWFQ